MMIMGYTFAHPIWFLALLLIPSLIVLKKYYFNKKATLQVSQIANFKAVAHRSLKLKALKILPLFFYLPLCLIIIALARPQSQDTKVNKTMEGLDIVIVLDVSDSMLIEDMQPYNRLESAKQTISEFISKRSSDRIGVVIFAGEAFTLVPPSLDYELIQDRVGKIQTAADARIKDGTAIGVALAAGAARLKDSQAKSKVMIFLTDGENNSGTIDPETGLEIAKGYGIKIYSIGIGRSGKTRLPIYREDVFGNKVKSFQPFESYVNDELLSLMAKQTNGQYFRASKENSLQGVFEEINKLETTKIEQQKYIKYNEHYQILLKWALFILALYFVLKFSVLRKGP